MLLQTLRGAHMLLNFLLRCNRNRTRHRFHHHSNRSMLVLTRARRHRISTDACSSRYDFLFVTIAEIFVSCRCRVSFSASPRARFTFPDRTSVACATCSRYNARAHPSCARNAYNAVIITLWRTVRVVQGAYSCDICVTGSARGDGLRVSTLNLFCTHIVWCT